MSYIDNFDLNSKFKVIREVKTNDGKGYYSISCSTVASSVDCNYWMNTANEIFISGRTHNQSGWSLACLPSTDYRKSDKIVIGSDTFTITTPDNVSHEDNLMIIGMELKG